MGKSHSDDLPISASVISRYLVENGFVQDEEQAIFHGLKIHDLLTEAYHEVVRRMYEQE